MKLTIVGAGHVGLVTAACFAEAGHDVFCLHDHAGTVDVLNGGGVPFHEAGLAQLLERNMAAGRLVFSTDVAASVAHSHVQMIAVGTPTSANGGADLADVLCAARAIGRHATGAVLLVLKSTVPVGTSDQVEAVWTEEALKRSPPNTLRCTVAVNPEFLREGSAVEDFQKPDRVLIGSPNTPEGEAAYELLARFYAGFVDTPEQILWMQPRSAELAKYAANAMLATRISFMNELAGLADAVGADIEQIRRGIGSDKRIGKDFLHAGLGYGGSCLPKDVRALLYQGTHSGQSMPLLSSVHAINGGQTQAMLDKVSRRHGADLRGKTIAVWGLAFKPGTDDMREAPSRPLVAALLARGAQVRATDPAALSAAAHVFAVDLPPALHSALSFHADPLDAARGSDGVLLVTEWADYRNVDLALLKTALRDAVVFDGRNLFDPRVLAAKGLDCVGVGRQGSTRDSWSAMKR